MFWRVVFSLFVTTIAAHAQNWVQPSTQPGYGAHGPAGPRVPTGSSDQLRQQIWNQLFQMSDQQLTQVLQRLQNPGGQAGPRTGQHGSDFAPQPGVTLTRPGLFQFAGMYTISSKTWTAPKDSTGGMGFRMVGDILQTILTNDSYYGVSDFYLCNRQRTVCGKDQSPLQVYYRFLNENTAQVIRDRRVVEYWVRVGPLPDYIFPRVHGLEHIPLLNADAIKQQLGIWKEN